MRGEDNIKINLKDRVLGLGHLSPRELYEGNLEGGIVYWGTRRLC